MELSLSTAQLDIVYHVLSLTLATMFGAGIFFFAARSQVAPRYRPAPIISGRAVFILPMIGPGGDPAGRDR